VLSLVCAPVCASAQSYPGVGLEVGDPHVLPLVIKDLPPAAVRLGITVERIREAMEIRLRQAGIQPESEALRDYCLVIHLRVAGPSVQSSIQFVRTVTYKVKAISYVVVAPTWHTARMDPDQDDPGRILSGLESLLDRFLEDFQSANHS